MLLGLMTDRPWFAAKRYGYGASLPITWEGWAAVALTGGAIAASALFLRGAPRLVADAAVIAAICALAASRTEGGWRWRFGRD
jgi:hypothetical protein